MSPVRSRPSAPVPSDGLAPFRVTVSGLRTVQRSRFGRPGHVVSILDPGNLTPAPLRRGNGGRVTRMAFHDAVRPTRGKRLPSATHVRRLVRLGRRLAVAGCRHVHVHCYQGVSRSTAAALIVMAAGSGRGAADGLLEELDRIRPKNWPNSRMVALADRQMGYRGRLTAALRAHQRRKAHRDPTLARLIRSHSFGHRRHEVPEGV